MKTAAEISPRAATTAADEAKSRAWYLLVLIFVLLASGILAGGIFSYRNYQVHFRTEVEQQLSAITELKTAQIVRWRRERMADAVFLRRTPYVARRALDVLARPASATTRQMFVSWLKALCASGSYEQVLLLDERLNLGLVYPEGTSGVLGDVALRAAQEALRTREVVVADLHQETENGPVHLSIMIPLIVRRESSGDNVPAAGVGSSSSERSTGVLVLQLNAQKDLYPLVQQWPTLSQTAETLLVRRDGSNALFLNDLKYQTNTALKLRIPLASTNVPAVRAARGQEGIVEGIDYRGVPVLASLRAIPGSPWSMVARMDLAEVYAPVRQRLGMTVLLMAALLLSAGAAVGLVWRQQRVGFYRERAAAAEMIRASEEKFRTLVENIPQRIFIKDRNLRFASVNQHFARDLGISPEEAVGKADGDFFPRELADKYRADDERIMRTGQTEEMEEKYVQDGREVWVHAIKSPVRDERNEITGVFGIFWDITESKRAADQLQQQTEEIQARNEELRRFNRAAVGRELRMIELKREINELCSQASQPPRYALDFVTEPGRAER